MNIMKQRIMTQSTQVTRTAVMASSTMAANTANHNTDNNDMFKQVLMGIMGMTGLSLMLQQSMDPENFAKNCGIVGVVGADDARDFLLEGLTVLQNRGYDSAGLATIDDKGSLNVTKFASKGSTHDSIDLIKNHSKEHDGHHIGIAHTRWATHGGKTDQNAHPHTDHWNRIALCHNGTINNSHELRDFLKSKGIVFKSETDTEVIAQLIGYQLEVNKCKDLKTAVTAALKECEGTWGLCVISKDSPDEIVVACNGSPMVLGIGEKKIYIASETSAFNRYTKNFIAMKDGEIGVLRKDMEGLDLSRMEIAPHVDILLSPDPYPHWALRELLEQPEAIARALGFGGRFSEDKVYLGGLDRKKERLASIENLLLSGCGTSLHAAMYGAKLMRDLESFNSVQTLDSAECRPSDFPNSKAGLLAISQSGETKDVQRVVATAEKMGIPTLSVVNVVGSLIARTTKLGVYTHAGREYSVASTKAFTTQVTVLALIAAWFRQLRDEEVKKVETDFSAKRQPTFGYHHGSGLPDATVLFEALQRLPISFGMAIRSREACLNVAKRLHKKNHCFVLGKGYGEPIALEGALKLKEMAYIHAEGYSGGALKHGPFALIEGPEGKDGATPIIMIILDDEHAHHMRTAAEEVKARGADVIVITDNKKLAKNLDDNPILIPSNGPLTALIATLPLQMIAYELSLLNGINPDKPRNLAKAVTTD